MRASIRYGTAIVFLTGASLLGVSWIAGLEGLRILATMLLVGAAIIFGAAAGISANSARWLERTKSLSPRTLACVAIAALAAPALIALILSLVNAVQILSSDSPTSMAAFLVGISLLGVVGGAAATALAAVRGGSKAARLSSQ